MFAYVVYAMEQGVDKNVDLQSSSTKRMIGKVVVITGGARGIGAATAKLFAENGASVVIADVLDESGTVLAESIGARYVHCDVSKESDVELAIQLAVAWKGKLDVLFSNAGIGGTASSIVDLDMEQAKHLISINLLGNVHAIKHAARAMLRCDTKGSIICTSSSAGIMGGLASHPYSLSKAGILGLMRTAACELGVHGIRVNCISPHGVPTDMLVSGYRIFRGKEMTPEQVVKLVGEQGSLLRGKAATVEDVARAAMFLATDGAGFITGHNLVIDGGYTSAIGSLSFIYK
ncbi:Short-chain dehydrogenase reductase ATA1 [Hibiscus syriacus]|uniref:Short-chain dehydrogenase reductase ATA1 n=1 Tax=Hibiscus syriacus TaxID=106335 RepID=A0A6A2WMC2_HIBSY|nr:short-chain dehydrogenase reductase ATA1-like [Hibiscus syriacus]KAE8654730.1 Short-chain dehydrogenase reductase ATA1 [Hibiscus syriacus]